MRENGLTLEKGARSRAEVVKNAALTDVLKLFGSELAGAIVWADNGVYFGTFDGGVLSFPDANQPDDKHVQRIRVFNESAELHAWRMAGGFGARLRIDGAGDAIEYIEADQMVEPTIAAKVPAIADFTHGPGRVAIRTRNYIDYAENGLAGYVDCRFVKFVNVGEEK
jgi:hypothetical protein